MVAFVVIVSKMAACRRALRSQLLAVLMEGSMGGPLMLSENT